MLCLPVFGTHANTQNLLHFRAFPASTQEHSPPKCLFFMANAKLPNRPGFCPPTSCRDSGVVRRCLGVLLRKTTSYTHRRSCAEPEGATATKNQMVVEQSLLQPPRPATGVSRALRARSLPGVSFGVSLGPFAPRAPECPKSVPRVSPECQKGVPHTPGTLSGHFSDTPEPGARRAPETPRGTLPGHFGPEGPERLLSQVGGGCNSHVLFVALFSPPFFYASFFPFLPCPPTLP